MRNEPETRLQCCSVAPCPGRHVLFAGDSGQCDYQPGFSLVLTSPPYYHTIRSSSRHGKGFVGNPDNYVGFVADVLCRVAAAVRDRRICVIKTDFWYKGRLVPIGYAIMAECIKRGMHLRAHWVWERVGWYSPYGPSLTNIFVLADQFSRPHFGGLISEADLRTRFGARGSHPPELYSLLIDLLTRPGDTLIDPFAGTGTALMAAANCGRFSVGIELSRAQVRTALQRLKSVPGFTLGVFSRDTTGHRKGGWQ